MLSQDVVAARVHLRVAELRLLAASTFVQQRSRQPPLARALLGNIPENSGRRRRAVALSVALDRVSAPSMAHAVGRRRAPASLARRPPGR